MDPRIYVFRQKKKSADGRNYLLAIPGDQIRSIESIYGSHNVYLKVNGREVHGSFDELIRQLGGRVYIS